MRLRFIPLLACFVAPISACSSSDFSLTSESDAATNDTEGTTTTDSVPTEEAGAVDGGSPESDARPDAPPTCTAADETTTTIYVDATMPSGGKGSNGCPFRTLTEAANVPLGAATTRVVRVRAAAYVELTPIRVRPRETYQNDGTGLVRVTGNGTAVCATGDSCTFQLDSNATLDGITLEGGTAFNGIVAAATSGAPPVIKNTAVRGAPRDGIVVIGVGAALGPNTHADTNGWSGMTVRNGKVSVNGVSNTFNGNKGGFYSGSTYIAGSGIHVRAGAGLFIDGGTTTNNNANGVFFDAGGSSGTQTLSQLTAVGNRSIGVHVPKGWQVVLRKSYLNKNGSYGLMVSFDPTTAIDLGTTAMPGGNTFGTTSSRNTKAGIFLCRSPKTGMQVANGNTWGTCPPTQLSVADCDTAPLSYVDVAYVPEVNSTDYGPPVASPVPCGST